MKKIVGSILDLSTKVVFSLDKNGMIGHGGERCQNAQKHFIIKLY